MTNEEAINVLNDYDINFERHTAEAIAEAHEMAIEALETQPSEDCISRQAAIDALWKALHEYEDKTENQFSESKELDVADWFQHRIFVQNMSDIDRQTILNLPSVSSQPKTGHWTHDGSYWKNRWICSECGYKFYDEQSKYCPNCGSYNGGTK
jgi:rubrerythrin